NNYLLFDGAMGSLLQQGGLKAGELPELLNITNKTLITNIHTSYLNNKAQVILTNTFGANPLKMKGLEYTLKEIVEAAIDNAYQVVAKHHKKAYVAYDIGPLGTLLQPSGTLSFEEAYDAFKEIVLLIDQSKVDVILIETMSDLLEVKAAVLAIKENTNLPVFVTMTFEDQYTTLCGNDVLSIVATLEGLKVDALGLNCSFGPKEMLPIVKQFVTYTSIPLMVIPNAGMPILDGDSIRYDIDEYEYLEYMKELLKYPIQIVGGCCGTKPIHIKLLDEYLKTINYQPVTNKHLSVVSSGMQALLFDETKVVKIGERINPSGKPILKEALLNNNYTYIIKEAMAQEEEGADVLDVNVGIPKVDEALLMQQNIKEIQSFVKLPLQIDSSSIDVLEAGLRIYNGKAMINSVNGKDSNLEAVLPLVAKYGGMVVGLCIDEQGLAYTIEAKVRIAAKIKERALAYGISAHDIIIDPLTLTASAQQADVKATIDAIKIINEQLGLKTSLGASNVSFGLPQRDIINASFLAMAIYAGLSACIINPKTKAITDTINASRVLLNKDVDSTNYLKVYQNNEELLVVHQEDDLQKIIIKGLKEEAMSATKKLLETRDPFDIIENEIVVALDYVGEQFESKKLFLPQLIQSAQTVSNAFVVIKEEYEKTQQVQKEKEKVVLATVKGDVHDIGKNIVKVLLENYGFDVIDLGKDVDATTIIDNIIKYDVKLVGLSALMTTTVISMEEIISAIKSKI
ncbi:MAG: homocysteine S-methyltransferase family protein, partial [Bacilli bacterium]